MAAQFYRFIVLAGSALIFIGAGAFAAREWNALGKKAEISTQSPAYGQRSKDRGAPVPERLSAVPIPASAEREPPLSAGESGRSGGKGALLQNLRRHAIREALEEPSAGESETAALAPSDSMAPLPPVRPPEFAAFPSANSAVPLPPARPRELAALAPPPAATEAALTPAPADASRADAPFRTGSRAYVRIFKQEGELELWLERNGRFALYRTYPVCKWSGGLGPKLKQGDYQSPEGFYSVSAKQLNPRSHYHLAFDVGFPNAFDRQNGRTGGAVMVHGDCKSVGCFAMTDKGIDEIYAFVAAAIEAGQREVPVHIFPFRMSDAALAKATNGDWTTLWSAPAQHQQWSSFWRNLKDGYDLFEQTGEPPTAYACGDHYAFGATGAACTKIAGW